MIGSTVGPYRIIAHLGQGAMGTVFRARHETMERDAALKIVTASGRSKSQRTTRFEREALAVSRLRHEGIVSVYDFGRADTGELFMAMELVDGTTLACLLAARPGPPLERRLGLVRDAARALHHAHEQGILHRDIKPSNILIAADGAVKVADFGLAQLSDIEEESRLTKTGMLLGTPLYMAPELLQTAKAASPQSDVYSLGVTLYEAVAGMPPREGTNIIQLAHAILAEPLQPPSQRSSGSPLATAEPAMVGAIDAVCARALAIDPTGRYRSASALADDIDRILGDAPSGRLATSAPRGSRPATSARAAAQAVAGGLGPVAIGAVSIVGIAALIGIVIGVAARTPSAPPPPGTDRAADTSPSPSPERAPETPAPPPDDDPPGAARLDRLDAIFERVYAYDMEAAARLVADERARARDDPVARRQAEALGELTDAAGAEIARHLSGPPFAPPAVSEEDVQRLLETALPAAMVARTRAEIERAFDALEKASDARLAGIDLVRRARNGERFSLRETTRRWEQLADALDARAGSLADDPAARLREIAFRLRVEVKLLESQRMIRIDYADPGVGGELIRKSQGWKAIEGRGIGRPGTRDVGTRVPVRIGAKMRRLTFVIERSHDDKSFFALANDAGRSLTLARGIVAVGPRRPPPQWVTDYLTRSDASLPPKPDGFRVRLSPRGSVTVDVVRGKLIETVTITNTRGRKVIEKMNIFDPGEHSLSMVIAGDATLRAIHVELPAETFTD